MSVVDLRDAAAQPAFTCPLPLCASHLELQFRAPVPLAEYPLVTLSGLLGYAVLRHFHPKLPPGVNPPADSPYWPILRPGEGGGGRGSEGPGVVLTCRPGAGAALALRFSLRTVGEHVAYHEFLLERLEDFEEKGFGTPPTPYVLAPVHGANEPPPWAPEWQPDFAGAFLLRLVTPLHLTQDKQDVHGLMQRGEPLMLFGRQIPGEIFVLYHLLRSTRSRLDGLAQRAGVPVEMDSLFRDNTALLRLLEREVFVLRSSFEIYDGYRRSSRTNSEVSIGGLLGFMEMEAPPAIQQFLHAAALLGVGKKVAHGNGRVDVTQL
ncbi:MAG: hypothetical protein HYV27_08030 [Candidatus Hydrogenedentes bacterium]|nr:hypothetical protein [Candidatus Hydrogenedentota bacterium]